MREPSASRSTMKLFFIVVGVLAVEADLVKWSLMQATGNGTCRSIEIGACTSACSLDKTDWYVQCEEHDDDDGAHVWCTHYDLPSCECSGTSYSYLCDTYKGDRPLDCSALEPCQVSAAPLAVLGLEVQGTQGAPYSVLVGPTSRPAFAQILPGQGRALLIPVSVHNKVLLGSDGGSVGLQTWVNATTYLSTAGICTLGSWCSTPNNALALPG